MLCPNRPVHLYRYIYKKEEDLKEQLIKGNCRHDSHVTMKYDKTSMNNTTILRFCEPNSYVDIRNTK